MTSNPKKAIEILELLSAEYEKTKDPNTAEKIVAIVDNEIGSGKFSYVEDRQQEIVRRYGILLLIPPFKRMVLNKSPFKVYWELTAGREEALKEKEAERLHNLYSTDAKSPSQIKDETKATEERVFETVKGEIGYLARSIAMADESLGNLILSRPIMDEYGTESVISISHFLEDIAHKVLTIAQCNAEGELTGDTITSGDEYVKYLSNRFVSKKMSNQEWGLERLSHEQYEHMKNRSSRFGLLDEILTERVRQITKHGYSEAHDDEHIDGSIADAAAHYASTRDDTGLWPWDVEYDKKSTKTRREQLITSISMLVAEVERLDRLEITTNTQGDSHE